MTTSGERRVAGLAMIGSAACWGSATVMSRDLLVSMTSIQLLLVQLMASVCVLLALAAPRFPWTYRSREMTKGALCGVLEPGLAYVVGLAGLAQTTAGRASVISASEPVLIVLVAWVLFHQRPGLRLMAAIAIAVGGLVMVSWSPVVEDRGGAFRGDLMVVLATLFAAGYVVISSRIVGSFPAASLASGQQMVGLAFAMLVYAGAMAHGDDMGGFGAIPGGTLAYAALSGVVQYALAFWLYLIGLRYLSAGAAGLWLTLIPVFGLAGAWFWLGERPGLLTVLGAVVIVSAVVLGNRGGTE